MVSTTEIVAIDVGPTRCGVAHLRDLGLGKFRVVAGAHVEHGSAWLSAVLRSAVANGAVVAFEVLQGYAYEAKRVAQLIETARVEGRLIERVSALGARIELRTAGEWRGVLCGTPRASDAQVRIAVEGLCTVAPSLGSDEREHVLDAAGLGLVVLSQLTKRPLYMPSAVRLALFRQQADDAAEAKAKRARGATAPKRAPTRAQRERKARAAVAAHQRRS